MMKDAARSPSGSDAGSPKCTSLNPVARTGAKARKSATTDLGVMHLPVESTGYIRVRKWGTKHGSGIAEGVYMRHDGRRESIAKVPHH